VTPPPEGTVLDRRTLNRTLLARQLLLERVSPAVPDTIEHLVGMQAQVPRDPYITLWSRLRAFQPTDLERLFLDRAVVRMTLMRTTLHLVTARDAVQLRPAMQDVCARSFASSPFRRDVEGLDLDEVRDAGMEILGAETLTTAELGRRLAQRWPDRPANSLAYVVRYLLPVVQVPPRGLLSSTAAPRLAPVATWLGVDGASLRRPAAADEILLRYLRAFGPATTADVRTWSWLTAVKPVIDRLRPALRLYRDEAGRQLYDVEEGIFESGDVPAPVRFLGEYDNAFLSHADRSRITGDHKWGAGWVGRGAILVDGFLAGAWSIDGTKDHATVRIEPLEPLPSSVEDEVVAEARALGSFLIAGEREPQVELSPDRSGSR
jgi:hypothetical protein